MNGPTDDAIGERLRAAREYLGLSQDFVARRVGIRRSALSDVERGARKVSANELRELADLYGQSTDSLLRGEPETDDDIRALGRVAGQLTPEDRAEVLQFAKFLRTKGTADARTPGPTGRS